LVTGIDFMEKRGVIEPGRTPPENEERQPAEKTAADKIAKLDNDFRKRAAETVVNTAK
jgi:hypothetical protein